MVGRQLLGFRHAVDNQMKTHQEWNDGYSNEGKSQEQGERYHLSVYQGHGNVLGIHF